MEPIPTRCNPGSPEFLENAAAMETLVAQLRDRLRQVREGGRASARARLGDLSTALIIRAVRLRRRCDASGG